MTTNGIVNCPCGGYMAIDKDDDWLTCQYCGRFRARIEIEEENKVDAAQFDTDYTPSIVCPYCGEVFTDSWEVGTGHEEDGETECDGCGKTMFYSRHLSVSYSTRKIEEVQRGEDTEDRAV